MRGDFLNLPFKEETFDGVTCMDQTFGYFGLEGDLLQLNEMSRILRPRGRLFIETYDKEFAKKYSPDPSWGSYDPMTDRFSKTNLYSPRQWKSMTLQSGIRLVKALSADDYSRKYFKYSSDHRMLMVLGYKEDKLKDS